MKRISFPTFSGLLIATLGLLNIVGWYLHIPALISVIPGYINMVSNTAICFILSGLALVVCQDKSAYQKWSCLVFGTLILAIAVLTLIEYAFSTSLGIDQLFVQVWYFDQNPYPGRMAINTSVAFVLTGLSLILIHYSNKQVVALMLQSMIFLLFFLGISAIFGYLLKLEFLYSWYQYTRMAIHTSAGITLLSLALWQQWSNSTDFLNLYHGKEDKKIILLGSMILFSVASISVLTGFVFASEPIGMQGELVVVILAITISAGVLLLYWQVLPLVQQLVHAKKDALDNSINLSAIFNHAAEGIITINTSGKVESLNPAVIKMFGYTESELLGNNLDILIPHHLRKKHHDGLNRYLQSHDSEIVGKHRVEVSGLRKNNEEFTLELAITEMHIDGQCKFVGMMHDISDRKDKEEKILESESRFRLSFDYSPIGMALVSLEGRWLKVNNALCEIVGYSESELLQIDFQSITYPDDLDEDLGYVKQLYIDEIPYYRMEKRYIRKDKTLTWVLLTGSIIRNERGVPLYYIAQIQDINDKKKAEEDLSFKAYYDALTGLMNRNHLEHSFDLAVSTAMRCQHGFSMFFIDLDNFKDVNDSEGHDAGDKVLKIVSSRLLNIIRKTDIAARLGGDEFILILNNIDTAEKVLILAGKILDSLRENIVINEKEFLVTASIGISIYPLDGTDYRTLVKNADLALYKAKEAGRNNYQLYMSEMNDEIKSTEDII